MTVSGEVQWEGKADQLQARVSARRRGSARAGEGQRNDL